MRDLTIKEVVEIIETGGDLIVDFYAPWCKPCEAMARQLETINVGIEIVKVNVETNDVYDFGVSSVPTLVKYSNSEEVARTTGYVSSSIIYKTFA